MSFYLIQASYSTLAIAAMVKNPQDRAEAIRPMIEKLNCKLHGFWFTFGEYDIVAVVEAPDSTTVAAISFAIGASGSVSAYRTTPLFTSGEAVDAMKRVAQVSYQAPK